MFPSLDRELTLLDTYEAVISVDEVGRGALAGPVAVGATLFKRTSSTEIPAGLKDSKLIAESKRDAIGDLSRGWLTHSVGYSSVGEIESQGITKALEIAAVRAIESIYAPNSVVLLDGSHNWLKESSLQVDYQVVVKADRDCASVSAAALIAKTERDALMRELHLEFPDFGWDGNKGYASEAHIAAIQKLGPTFHHRTSWLTKILGGENKLF